MLPGPQTELELAHRLERLDRVQVYSVAGSALPQLLDVVDREGVLCGADAAGKTVGGWPIEAGRHYRVVSTDRFVRATALPGLGEPNGGDRGTLRTAVLQQLREAREDDIDVIEAWGAPPRVPKPQWLIRLTRASTSLARFDGVEDRQRFELVPETLATNASSLTVTTDLDAALVYQSRPVGWDLRLRSQWSRLNAEDADPVEQADDVLVSSSLSLPQASWRLGSVWAPYSETLLDSEWTATESEEGDNPRQADLSLAAGVSTSYKALTRLRLGAFVLRDLAASDKGLEPGVRLEASTSAVIRSGATWTTQVDLFVFANSPNQDASDLRTKGWIDTRLSVRLWEWVNVAPNAQLFVLAGRVPENRAPAATWTLGVSLDLAAAFML